MTLPTLHDRLTLLPTFGLILGHSILNAVNGIFLSPDHQVSYGDYVFHSLVRNAYAHFNVGQFRLLLPPFLNTYQSFCKTHNLTPLVEDIPNTSIKGFWLGSKASAEYVMIYLHGGGYVMPGLSPHLEMLWRFVEWSDGKMAVFCPCYTLAPEARYPVQIGECVEALRYVLSKEGWGPENVCLGGDSAGGSLALAILSHVSGHPHPRKEVVRELQVERSLRGVLLISPWVSREEARFESFRSNIRLDTVGPVSMHYWIAEYKGDGVDDDEFMMANLAAPEWWFGCKVSSVLMTVGNNEGLRDSVIDTARKFEQGATHVDFKLVVAKGERHDGCMPPKPVAVLDEMGETCSEGAIRSWLKTKL